MPARSGYEHLPAYWNTWLAVSVGRHINKDQPEEQLEHDYQLYLDSPAVSRELREMLPGLPVKKRKRARA